MYYLPHGSPSLDSARATEKRRASVLGPLDYMQSIFKNTYYEFQN